MSDDRETQLREVEERTSRDPDIQTVIAAADNGSWNVRPRIVPEPERA